MNIDLLSVNAPKLPDDLTVCQLIGHGGAGEIWLVKDITGKNLAAKIINSRWQAIEFDAISSFRTLPSHPALVQIYQAGKLQNGDFFYTMEIADNASADSGHYIPDTLANRIAEQKMDCREILTIMQHITAGVKHLHDHNLFHGDIKPENIVFVNGKAKLADFGMISDKISGGTAGFIPDDPVSGSDRDCYALGKTIYCLWSRLDSAEFPALPEKFSPDEAKIIRPIYLQACSNKQNKRFSSVEKFLTALITAEKKLQKPRNKIFRNLILLTGIVIFMLLVITAVVFIRPKSPGTTTQPPKITNQLPETTQPTHIQTTDSIDIVEIKFSSDISLARSIHRSSMYFTGEFKGAPDFRKLFNKACRDIPQYLDHDEVKWTNEFYRKSDELIRLRTLLADPELSDEEFLQIFETNDYQTLFSDLSKQSGELFHQLPYKKHQAEKRQYFLTQVFRNNSPMGVHSVIQRHKQQQNQ